MNSCNENILYEFNFMLPTYTCYNDPHFLVERISIDNLQRTTVLVFNYHHVIYKFRWHYTKYVISNSPRTHPPPTLASSWYGENKRGLMNIPVLRTRTHALAMDRPLSSPNICEGGRLTRPRFIAPTNTSWFAGMTWSVRT